LYLPLCFASQNKPKVVQSSRHFLPCVLLRKTNQRWLSLSSKVKAEQPEQNGGCSAQGLSGWWGDPVVFAKAISFRRASHHFCYSVFTEGVSSQPSAGKAFLKL
jgi:hypothetical protein